MSCTQPVDKAILFITNRTTYAFLISVFWETEEYKQFNFYAERIQQSLLA